MSISQSLSSLIYSNTFFLIKLKSLISGNVYNLPFLSRGISSIVYIFSETSVIKAPRGTNKSLHKLTIKHAIYERLGSHPYVTKVLSIYNNILVLERLQYYLYKRLWDLRDVRQLPLT
jgi:hypothetical protein